MLVRLSVLLVALVSTLGWSVASARAEWPTTDFVFECDDYGAGDWAPRLKIEPRDDDTYCSFENVAIKGKRYDVHIDLADIVLLSQRLTHAAKLFEFLGFEPPALPRRTRSFGASDAIMPSEGYVVQLAPFVYTNEIVDTADAENHAGHYIPRPPTRSGRPWGILRITLLDYVRPDENGNMRPDENGDVRIDLDEVQLTVAHELFHAVEETHLIAAGAKRDLLKEGWISEGIAEAMGGLAQYMFERSGGVFRTGPIVRADMPPLSSEYIDGRLTVEGGLPIAESDDAAYDTDSFWLHVLSKNQINDYGALVELYEPGNASDDAITMVDEWLREQNTHLVRAMEELARDVSLRGTEAHAAIDVLLDCRTETVSLDTEATPHNTVFGIGSAFGNPVSGDRGFENLRMQCLRLNVASGGQTVTARLLDEYQGMETSSKMRVFLDGARLSDGEIATITPNIGEPSTLVVFMSEPDEPTAAADLGPASFAIRVEAAARGDCATSYRLYDYLDKLFVFPAPVSADMVWNDVSLQTEFNGLTGSLPGCLRVVRTLLPGDRSSWTMHYVTPARYLETWGFHIPPGVMEPARLSTGDLVTASDQTVSPLPPSPFISGQLRQYSKAQLYISERRFDGRYYGRSLRMDIQEIGETGLTADLSVGLLGTHRDDEADDIVGTTTISGRVEIAFDTVDARTVEGLVAAAHICIGEGRMQDAVVIAKALRALDADAEADQVLGDVEVFVQITVNPMLMD